MLVRVRKIGNSQGVILSKNMMEQCNIKDIVNVEVKGAAIVIEPATENPRAGWEEQFRQADSQKDEDLLDGLTNAFDESEWTW